MMAIDVEGIREVYEGYWTIDDSFETICEDSRSFTMISQNFELRRNTEETFKSNDGEVETISFFSL